MDRDLLDKEDEEDIDLDDDAIEAISKPFAKVALRSKTLTKHGRAIIDSKDAIEAAVILFMWTGRVNRIGKKIRRIQNAPVSSGETLPQESETPLPAFSGGQRHTYN